jgi:hypothetical protein
VEPAASTFVKVKLTESRVSRFSSVRLSVDGTRLVESP